jgi:membrane protein DedA with SNARE-associated domain
MQENREKPAPGGENVRIPLAHPLFYDGEVESFLQWVADYGYVALFVLLMLGIVGLPVPDETLLAFAGYLVYEGHLALLPTVLSAFLGSVCGISVSYALGRGLGVYLVQRLGPALRFNMAKLDQVNRWFAHRGMLLLFFGYFIPGVRHFTALVAGSSRLRLDIFALSAFSGALFWCASFITLGYFLEERWVRLSVMMHRIVIAVGVVCLLVALAYTLIRRYRGRVKRREKRAPL